MLDLTQDCVRTDFWGAENRVFDHFTLRNRYFRAKKLFFFSAAEGGRFFSQNPEIVVCLARICLILKPRGVLVMGGGFFLPIGLTSLGPTASAPDSVQGVATTRTVSGQSSVPCLCRSIESAVVRDVIPGF